MVSSQFARAATGGVVNNLNSAIVAKSNKSPSRPLEVQQEIVAEIEGYQKVIDGARAVVENYRHQIVIDPEWPVVPLSDACELIMDGTHFSPKNVEQGERLYLTSKNVRENHLDLSNVSYVSEADHESIIRAVRSRREMFSTSRMERTQVLRHKYSERKILFYSQASQYWRGKQNYLDNQFLCLFLNTPDGRSSLLSMMSGVAIRRLTLTKINRAQIPLPPIQDQKRIAQEIEAEQAVIKANRELIKRFEKKIRRRWGGCGVKKLK